MALKLGELWLQENGVLLVHIRDESDGAVYAIEHVPSDDIQALKTELVRQVTNFKARDAVLTDAQIKIMAMLTTIDTTALEPKKT